MLIQLPRFGKHDERGPGTRNADRPVLKDRHRDPTVELEYPRKIKAAKAGSNNSNEERRTRTQESYN
jgi:hypothetical protein